MKNITTEQMIAQQAKQLDQQEKKISELTIKINRLIRGTQEHTRMIRTLKANLTDATHKINNMMHKK